MSIITCPECGKEVSDRAPSCIGCGYPLQQLRKLNQMQQSEQPGQAVEFQQQDFAQNIGENKSIGFKEQLMKYIHVAIPAAVVLLFFVALLFGGLIKYSKTKAQIAPFTRANFEMTEKEVIRLEGVGERDENGDMIHSCNYQGLEGILRIDYDDRTMVWTTIESLDKIEEAIPSIKKDLKNFYGEPIVQDRYEGIFSTKFQTDDLEVSVLFFDYEIASMYSIIIHG